MDMEAQCDSDKLWRKKFPMVLHDLSTGCSVFQLYHRAVKVETQTLPLYSIDSLFRQNDSLPTLDEGDISYKWLWRNGFFSAAIGPDWIMETPYHQSVLHVFQSINIEW